MSISAAQVNELRKKTGAGMMDCKKALVESDGDFEKAIEYLRKKGAAIAAKRADKVANEGIIVTNVSNDYKYGLILEVNCETDFVAKTDDFINLVHEVVNKAMDSKASNLDELLEKNPDLPALVNDVMAKVGEKTEIRRLASLSTDTGYIGHYTHIGSKLGVILQIENVNNISSELMSLTEDIAIQVAAMNPVSIYRDEVPKDLIEKELEIYKELALKEGKPENLIEKIALGKMNKYYQDNCLIEQSFFKDNTKTINDLILDYNKKNNTQIKVSKFIRFHLGDEKK